MRHMLLAFVGIVFVTVGLVCRADDVSFRPPAVPLVTFDPYLSIWSEADRLTDDLTRHWTHHPHPLVSVIRVDGKAFRLMGNEPKDIPALPQISVRVQPTRSIYEFQNPQIHVTLTFMTAALPNDLQALSRPVSYITWSVKSADGGAHTVAFRFAASALLTVNRPDQKVTSQIVSIPGLAGARMGTVDQPILATMGDDTRIDWGYLYVVAPNAEITIPVATTPDSAAFAGAPPSLSFDLGSVGTNTVERHAILAYDEVYAINYFGRKLRPYWRRKGMTPEKMLQAAERDYPTLVKRCEAFDTQLMTDMESAGGPKYAQIAALAYRQALAACGLAADANGQPLLFTKENTSNGDIATVDVIFPMAPMLILLSPSLAKASIVPILSYAASPHWKFPNAPHDLGTYPVAMGRDDGGEGMPVEESGNMLILCDAIAQAEGKPDFVAPWWPQLTQWAKYLEQYGLDPEDQLCTDDFMGHLAHNANLSIKAILGLAAYGDLCRMRGDALTAARYAEMAKTDASHWVTAAADGDHSRLAFDRPKTWSQKYNLVWDRILGLNVFPQSVADAEIAEYKRVIERFGVPLDSRTRLTKTDWSLWVATLASNPADFQAIVSPIYDYLNTTTARSPLVDSYITNDIHSDGMHARPVVGGIFIKMLADRPTWERWARADHTPVGRWAPLPEPPVVTEIIPTAQHSAVMWRYTTTPPGADWMNAGFDSSAWSEGKAGFGTAGTPGAVIGTTWNSDDIWLRRTFAMPAKSARGELRFYVYHDEDVEVYINGVPAASESGFTTSYVPLNIRPAALAQLRPGATITLAVHCHQTTGGQGVDVGISTVMERGR